MSNCESPVSVAALAEVPKSQALALREPRSLGLSLEKLAHAAFKSQLFGKFKNAEAALVVMAYGNCLGLDPVTALTSIHSIDGKPVISGNLMWCLVKGNPSWKKSKVIKRDDESCIIHFIEDGDLIGIAEYTMEDAKRAGLTGKDVWKKYPRAMLFNRAISEGFKAYCPHLGNGLTLYTPEELGGNVNEEGDYLQKDGEYVDFEIKPSGLSNGKKLEKMLKECRMELKVLSEAIGIDEVDLKDPTDDELLRIEKLLNQRKVFQE